MTSSQPTEHSRREETRQRVISESIKAFRSQGIRNVTMDDIARKLSMSKRTLYQLFADKEQLLLACIKQYVAEDDRQWETLQKEKGTTVLSLLLLTLESKLREAEEVHPCFFEDMMRYPSVLKFFDEHKREREDEAVAFLDQGKAEGFFRPEVNFRIIYRQLMVGCNSPMTTELFNTYPHREVLANTIVPYIRGCATIEGIRLIDEFMSTRLSEKLRYHEDEDKTPRARD